MASDFTVVDTLKDAKGRTVKVGYRGREVEIVVTPHSGHQGRIAFDTHEQHERFAAAYGTACLEANPELLDTGSIDGE